MSLNNLIITQYKEKNICFKYSEDRIDELIIDDIKSINVNDIFIGRISAVKPDINAYFVDIAEGITGFLSFDDIYSPLIANPRPGNILKQGDLLCVQVSKDRIKSKEYTLTQKITIPGSFTVVTLDDSSIHVSKKIKNDEANKLFGYFNHKQFDYGFVLRTNSINTSLDDVENEIITNSLILKEIVSNFSKRSLYSKLFNGKSSFIERINGINRNSYDEIITDIPEFIDQLKIFDKVRFYSDDKMSLKALYSFDKAFDLATSKKVNLRCGGYLVIEPTEALTVIDVNSGKFEKNVSKEDAIRIVNSEACVEICRQLRLRNLSGIIIVDFININSKDNRDELIGLLKKELKKDSLKVSFIDITPLGLVEITREKKYPSIYDILSK